VELVKVTSFFLLVFLAPSGRYTPLKLINGKKNSNLAKEDEDLYDKDVIGDDD